MDSLTNPQSRPTGAPSRRPVDHLIGVLLGVVATLIGLLMLAWLVLFVTKGRFLKPTFEKYASRFADRQVAVGGDFQLYFNPFHLKFLAEGLSLANPAWAKDRQLFTARRIDTEISTFDLLFGKQHVLYLDLDGGSAGLEIDKSGRNTWTFAGEEPFTLPPIDTASITGSTLHFIDAGHRADVRVAFGDLAGGVGPAGRTNVGGPLTFTGGGTALAEPFKLSGRLTTPNSTMTGGRTGLELHADVASTRIDVSGMLPGVTRIEGADLRISIAGQNLQSLFKLARLTAPATRPYKLSATFRKDGKVYNFTRIGGHFGDSDLAGSLVADTGGDRPKLTADLKSDTLDILDVGPWIGYSPNKLAAKGGAGAVSVENGHPRILPNAPLAFDGLKAFDARVKYRAAKIRTGNVPLTNLVLDLDLNDRRLVLKPVAFDVIGGRMTADIDLNARARPVVTAYDIRMTAVPIGRLLTSFKVEDSGTTASVGGRVQLKGYGDTVRDSLGTSSGRIAVVIKQGTLWIRNIQLAKLDLQNFLTAFLGKKLKKPSEIRCGVAAFTVSDGVSRADPVIFDTSRAVYRMNGQFSFKDESIDLSLKGDSKQFSLFSGQSPIGVGGYFAAPTVNPVSTQLLARAGASIALGVVATPVASLLAFVDLGDAKNTNCAAVDAARTAKVVDAAPPDPKKK